MGNIPHSPLTERPDDESHPVLFVNRSLESLLSMRPIYKQIRASALAFLFARAPPARCKGCRSVATKSLRVRDL